MKNEEKKMNQSEIADNDLEQVTGGIRDVRLTAEKLAAAKLDTAEYVVANQTIVKPIDELDELHAMIERTN